MDKNILLKEVFVLNKDLEKMFENIIEQKDKSINNHFYAEKVSATRKNDTLESNFILTYEIILKYLKTLLKLFKIWSILDDSFTQINNLRQLSILNDRYYNLENWKIISKSNNESINNVILNHNNAIISLKSI